jgi:hypothetical protein
VLSLFSSGIVTYFGLKYFLKLVGFADKDIASLYEKE